MISASERYKTLSLEELKIIEAATGEVFTQVLGSVAPIP